MALPDQVQIDQSVISLDSPSLAPPSTSPPVEMHGKYSVGYFINWGIYEPRKFLPSLIPVHDLTHILYAFADLSPDTGEVLLSDPHADKDVIHPGDSWEPGHNLYGNLGAIFKLKQKNRHLKVLLSIGGWKLPPPFHPVVVSPQARFKFVESAIILLEDYGLDGLDVDYEYQPMMNKQPAFIAAPCGPDKYKILDIRGMDPYLDFWNLMAYDFSGSWDTIANHQADLYGSPISASDAIEWYYSNGVPRSKLVLGIPLYGRSFADTDGPGFPFSGPGTGTWEPGVCDYRVLPLPGSDVSQDDEIIASWSYDKQKREMVSYDSEHIGTKKGQWIREQGLAGSMFWELSGDKGRDREGMEGGPGQEPVPGQSLVSIVKDEMGPLDHSTNWLRYEGSQYDNVRNVDSI